MSWKSSRQTSAGSPTAATTQRITNAGYDSPAPEHHAGRQPEPSSPVKSEEPPSFPMSQRGNGCSGVALVDLDAVPTAIGNEDSVLCVCNYGTGSPEAFLQLKVGVL